MSSLTDELYQALEVLEPIHLTIKDDSAHHAGHVGNSGGGHFRIEIVSSQFSGKSQIMRHRLIYQTLASYFPKKIHALSIHALAPNESQPIQLS